ncbi:glycosyltransferase [Pseudarthrobacter siccitolerans]
MARIVIVQPVLTAYRKTFFEGVVRALEAAGHTCLIVTGGERGNRKHSVTADWHRRRKSGGIRLKTAVIRYFGSAGDIWGADLAVVPLSTLWIDSYLALLMRKLRIGPKRVIMWGHVDSHSGTSHGIRERMADLQLLASDYVFSYTDSGRRSAMSRGVRADAVASLDNTVDLGTLAKAVESVALTASHTSKLAHLNLQRGKTFSYIGGLDGAKRIDFLAAALDLLWAKDKDIRLLVGGTGGQEKLLRPGIERGQVILLGQVDDRDKAEMAAASSALLMPGRVGLVAAESFVLGLPIVTTDNPYHAPEFDYLTPGIDCLVTTNDVNSYCSTVLELASMPSEVGRLRKAALSKSGWPSLDHMIDVFVRGCLDTLDGKLS